MAITEVNSVKSFIREFTNLMQQYPDQTEHTSNYIHFLKRILQLSTNKDNLPLGEIIAIIKHDRPNIFQHIMMQSQTNILLAIILQLNMNYSDAKTRLKFILK